MRKYLFIFIVSFFSLTQTKAQDSGLSFELHYPLVFADDLNSFSDVQGIFGGALQYQLTDNHKFNYGVEYRFDLSQSRKDNFNVITSTSFQYLMNHINLFTKLNVDEMEKFKVYIDAGFTVYKYKEGSNSQSYTGFNGGLGFNYDIMRRIYLQANFNYIKSFKKQQQTSFVDKESHQIIRFGLGFKI